MIFFLLTLFLTQLLCGDQISFSDLGEKWADQKIEIRGFLYRMEEGQLILAAEPNLKSCCVGTAKNRNKQITIKSDDLVPRSTVVELQGTLIMRDGYFLLDNASEKKKPPTNYLTVFLGGLGILGGTLYLRKRGKSHRDNAH